MEIQIIDKCDNSVRVSTEIGCFDGIWCSLVPATFKRYIVELDNDEVITASMTSFSDFCDSCIEQVGNRINITGFVEEVEDRVMILRLRESIMMLEISSDSDFLQYVGHYVCVSLNEIKLYDIGVC